MASVTDWAWTSVWTGVYFFQVRPEVNLALARIEERAAAIPGSEMRVLAEDSLKHKRFHCEGGAIIVGSSAGLIRFVTAYQTLCDCLDTVTDRGPAVTEAAIRTLHQSLLDAVSPGTSPGDYWQGHPFGPEADGGYFLSLVEECRAALGSLPGWSVVAPRVQWLAERYVDLQSIKHAPDSRTRAHHLEDWFLRYRNPRWDLQWWEFAAAAGSTLGIFTLVREATKERVEEQRVAGLMDCYFPWMGSLHILLDYFIDQQEDLDGGDFNFVTCYGSPEAQEAGIRRIFQAAMDKTQVLDDGAFHRYVARGLLAFYLADRKVRGGGLSTQARTLLETGGAISCGLNVLSRVGRAP